MAKETLGQRVRRLREAAGITQGRLAGMVGIDPTALNRIELGKLKQEPKHKTLEGLAKALGVSFDELVYGESGARGESRVVRETAYPSFDEFLASSLGRDITPDEEEYLRVEVSGFRSAEGDPGVEFYVHKLNSYRAAQRYQAQREKPRDLTEDHPKLPKIKPRKRTLN